MAFITKKKISGKEYFYLVERKREDGKVKSKTLCYLGKEKKEAEKKARDFLQNKEIIKNSVKDKPFMVDSSKKISIEDLANFCKRKGFVFRSSDIYGGFSGFWDFGPLGIELLNNIKKEWWNYFVHQKENIVGIEASVISHPKTWKASGHIDNFNDIFVKCKKCGKNSKLDESELGKVKCSCGGEYESVGKFNLMFETNIGAVDPEKAYLRGETAQGMFLDFKLVQQTSRSSLPFGIAQIGRCFRNEIAPRDFLFRCREFHIGEFEFFIHPDEKKCDLLEKEHLNCKFKLLNEENQKKENKLIDSDIKTLIDQGKLGEWHAYWLAEQIMWFRNLGLNEIKIREHTKEELSHYSSATFDIDYEYPFGSKEVAGNANRGQYDLMQHANLSKDKLEIFDEKTKQKVTPRVIEPTFGIERIFLAILSKAYTESEDKIILKIPPKLSPIKCAIFPIVKNDEKVVELSRDIYKKLKRLWNVDFDVSGSIGRRYARNDEIGTPFCITIDEDSIKNKTVTIRDRDTTKQIIVKISELETILRNLIEDSGDFLKAGELK